jgi:rhodanese-related sulfurtransferase
MADKSGIAAALAGSILFGNISGEAIEAIAGISHEATVPPNTTIVRSGDPGANCYIITSGSVRFFRTGKTGAEYDFLQLDSGESFGEVALLTGEPMPVSVKTVEETHFIVIPTDQFGPIMTKYPDVTAAVGRVVSLRLHTISSTVESYVDRKFEAPRLKWLDFVLIISLSVLCALAFNKSNPKSIPLFPKSFSDEAVSFVNSPAALKKQEERKALLVDAMPSNFYEQEHIAGAVSLPLAIFDFMYDLILGQTDKSKEIIVYGRTISKRYDEEVASKLVARGHKNVKILEGGLRAWKKNGFPVEP